MVIGHGPYAVTLSLDPVEVMVAACAGLLAGVLLCALALRARRPREAATPAPAPAPVAPALPAEVGQLLTALTSIGIVLDSADAVVASSPSAQTRGLLQGDEVAHPSLLLLARAVRASGEPCEERLWLPRGPQGARRLISARASALGNDHVLLLVEDQSQAHYLEEVRRDFVANVSHELKTPLGGLSLLAEAVRGAKDEPAAVNRFAKRMQKESRRLANVVNELVELSKLQSEDRLLDPQRVQLGEVVGRAAADVQVAAEEKGIRLAVRSDPGCWVWGDSHLLVTAVRNLIANAVAYSGPDTKVGVHARLRDDGGREIIVSDQGQGIPEAEQGRIFERFYRVDAARSRATGGTGLGLSIVKHVCTNHGGDVSVWSEVGRGSTFTITLPAPSLGPAVLETDHGDQHSATAADPAEPAPRAAPEPAPLRSPIHR